MDNMDNESDVTIMAEWTRNDDGKQLYCFVLKFKGNSDKLEQILRDQFGDDWSLCDSETAVGKHTSGLFLVLQNERDAVEFKLTHAY
jgi:hypothetical protein